MRSWMQELDMYTAPLVTLFAPTYTSIYCSVHDVKVGEGRSMKSFDDCKMLPSLSHKPTAIKPGSRSFHG